MKVKEIWGIDDFESMGWHDCRIYSIFFPDKSYKFSMSIDYIFSTGHDEQNRAFYWVSPVYLIFENVSDLSIHIKFSNFLQANIIQIQRDNERKTPNGNLPLWDFKVETDVGDITFSATGFIQEIVEQPDKIESQNLDR